jgi:hypothetical protein
MEPIQKSESRIGAITPSSMSAGIEMAALLTREFNPYITVL